MVFEENKSGLQVELNAYCGGVIIGFGYFNNIMSNK